MKPVREITLHKEGKENIRFRIGIQWIFRNTNNFFSFKKSISKIEKNLLISYLVLPIFILIFCLLGSIFLSITPNDLATYFSIIGLIFMSIGLICVLISIFYFLWYESRSGLIFINERLKNGWLPATENDLEILNKIIKEHKKEKWTQYIH